MAGLDTICLIVSNPHQTNRANYLPIQQNFRNCIFLGRYFEFFHRAACLAIIGRIQYCALFEQFIILVSKIMQWDALCAGKRCTLLFVFP